jgi:hypothetical protein
VALLQDVCFAPVWGPFRARLAEHHDDGPEPRPAPSRHRPIIVVASVRGIQRLSRWSTLTLSGTTSTSSNSRSCWPGWGITAQIGSRPEASLQ